MAAAQQLYGALANSFNCSIVRTFRHANDRTKSTRHIRSKQMNKQANKKKENKSANERMREQVERTNERMNERMNEQITHCPPVSADFNSAF